MVGGVVDLETRAVQLILERVQLAGAEPGANLGNMLRRELPEFDVRERYSSLRDFILRRVDRLAVVGSTGDDILWGVGDPDGPDYDALLVVDGPRMEDGPPPATLRRASLTNFKSCRDVTLDLDPVTVLVGPNAAGKSSILQGLFLASRVAHGRPLADFVGPRDLRRLRTHGTTGSVGFELVGDDLRMTARGTPDEEGGRFEVDVQDHAETAVYRFPVPSSSQPNLGATRAGRSFWPALLLNLRAEDLARPSVLDREHPKLRHSGAGLSSVLAWAAQVDPDRLDRITTSMRAIIPSVERIRTRPRPAPRARREPLRLGEPDRLPAGPVMENIIEVQMAGAGWVPGDLLSEGTLLALGLHTVLSEQVPPRILLLDDLDRGLHRRAQRTLARQLVEISDQTGIRIVTSTHSPFVLDELPSTSVRVVRMRADGSTRCVPLESHSAWKEWAEDMKPGEFWTWVGEEWLENEDRA